MNKTFASAGKEILLDLLSQCTPEQQMIFKRMYSHRNLELGIEEVIKNLPDEKIDWAISQCENTLKKINKNA